MIVSQNFINKISLMSDSRAVNFIKSISSIKSNSSPPTDLKFNFIDITPKEDIVTFLPPNRVSRNPFNVKYRSDIKIGRLIKYLSKAYKISLTNIEIEKFVNDYKSTLSNLDLSFEIVRGKDISKWYTSSHSTEKGTLGRSCMTNKPQEYFDLYSENKNVSLLILTTKIRKFPYIKSTKRLIGRALIWNLDKSPCSSKIFMDRVYTSKDSDVNKFYRLAESNNWMYKTGSCVIHNGSTIGRFYDSDDSPRLSISVKVDGDKKYYPYLDTFLYMNHSKDTLSTKIESNKYYTLCNMDGTMEERFDNKFTPPNSLDDINSLLDGLTKSLSELESEDL